MKPIKVKAFEIHETGHYDRIQVYFADVALGAGYVTITCYGCAWTAYFGAMGGDTIKGFFRRAGTDYLVTKMGITPLLKCRKRDDEYLAKIITAVKTALREDYHAAA